MEYEMEVIKDYIQVEHPSGIQNHISVLRGFSLMSGGLASIACLDYPDRALFQGIIATIVIVIIVWGWIESKDIEKYQKLHSLYMGVAYALLSLVFFLATVAGFLKDFGFAPGKTALIFGTGHLFALVVGGDYHRYNLKKRWFAAESKRTLSRTGMAGIIGGIMFFSAVIKVFFDKWQLTMGAFAVPALSYVCLMGTAFLHKYYLMKKYEQYVKVYHFDKKRNTWQWQ